MPTVAFFPSLSDLAGNPYWRLLAEALAQRGVVVLSESPRSLSLRWLWAQRSRVQVLHIHYFQDNYAYEGTQARLRWVLRFARNLVVARALGYRVVWTVHNEAPSFPLQPKWVEDLAHLAVGWISSAVIVHCQYARKLVSRHYRRQRGVFMTPHPNYIGVYPCDVTCAQARAWLGLPQDAIVFLCFGQIRPNKGIEGLLRAFTTLAGDRLRLVVAGASGLDTEYVYMLRRLAVEDTRILFLAELIPDERVQIYYVAADLVVAPFIHVLTSGSVMLSLSFGKPVIAPAIGCLPEIIKPNLGWLYDPAQPQQLQEFMRISTATDLKQMGLEARALAESLTWNALAKICCEAYIGVPCKES